MSRIQTCPRCGGTGNEPNFTPVSEDDSLPLCDLCHGVGSIEDGPA